MIRPLSSPDDTLKITYGPSQGRRIIRHVFYLESTRWDASPRLSS